MACLSSCKVTSSQRQTRTFTSLSGGCHFAANAGERALSLAFVELHTALNRVVEAAQDIDGQRGAPVAPTVDAPADDAAAIDEPGFGEELGAKFVGHDLRLGVDHDYEGRLVPAEHGLQGVACVLDAIVGGDGE